MTTATAADDKPRTHKGLAGVIADTTAISKVVPEINSHRGLPRAGAGSTTEEISCPSLGRSRSLAHIW